MIKYVHHT